MKTCKKAFSLLLALAIVVSLCLTGCGSDKKPSKKAETSGATINLNDYVVFSGVYYDGDNKVWEAHVDKTLLAADCLLYVRGFYDLSDIRSALSFGANYETFQLAAEEGDSPAETGDTLHFSWIINESGLEALKSRVNVQFTYSDITYTVGGTPAGKPSRTKDIPLEDYVSFRLVGYNGYAQLTPHIDLVRLRKDCVNGLVEGTNLNDFANTNLGVSFKTQSDVTGLSNGDTLQIRVFAESSDLAGMLAVDLLDAEITYTVKGLKEYRPAKNTFEIVNFSYDALVDLDGQLGYDVSDTAILYLETPDGVFAGTLVDVDVSGGSHKKVGDTLRVSIPQNTIDKYTQLYGQNIFAQTSADVALANMAYLPTGDNAGELFDLLDAQSLENAASATQEMAEYCTETEVTVELLGMLLYYDDEGKLVESEWEFGDEPTYKFYNQLVLVYKLTDAYNPDGWYTYMAYNGEMLIYHRLNSGTLEVEKFVGNTYSQPLDDDYRYYHCEHYRLCSDDPYTRSFECNGKPYPGHKDLAEVFKAIDNNLLANIAYDHLIVTEGLADYVEAY